jgi:hypothetical protein
VSHTRIYHSPWMECVILPHTHRSMGVSGDCNLEVSAIGNCLDEEKETVFDIQTLLYNIKQIQDDGATENTEECLRHVLRVVFAFCHDIHNTSLKTVVTVTSELM